MFSRILMLRTNILRCFGIQTSFCQFQFCGPHTKPHGVIGLSNHCHKRFDPKLEPGIWEIRCIPYVCPGFISMLETPWIHGLKPQQQPLYQPVIYCTYWPVLGSFKNWNIITFSHTATTSEYFEEIHQVVLGGNSKNIARLFQHSKCSTTNTTGTPTMVYYVIKFFSEAYTLQDENTRDEKKVHLMN